MPSVTQEWMHAIPFMQQTVLLTAIRAPDGTAKYSPPKMLLRWLRRCTLVSALDGEIIANPYDERGGSFTGPSMKFNEMGTEASDKLFWKLYHRAFQHDSQDVLFITRAGWYSAMWQHVGAYLEVLDTIPLHFHKHFIHASEILGVHHPDQEIRRFWHLTYLRLVDDLHLNPESADAMNSRLGDSRSGWLARGDVATER